MGLQPYLYGMTHGIFQHKQPHSLPLKIKVYKLIDFDGTSQFRQQGKATTNAGQCEAGD